MEVAVAAPSYATEDARGRPLAPAERLRHPLCSPPAAESAAETLEAEIRQHGRALVPVERLRHEEAAQATLQAEPPPMEPRKSFIDTIGEWASGVSSVLGGLFSQDKEQEDAPAAEPEEQREPLQAEAQVRPLSSLTLH